MKILLQHAVTLQFFRNGGDWTSNPDEAFDFEHSQRAIDFSRLYNLTDTQIAVKFIDSEFDTTFPMPEAQAIANELRP
jgi:hypothetical protein